MNDDHKQLKPVWGAEGIGKVLGTSRRRTFYLLENNLVPARKIGKSWVSTTAELESFLLGRLPAPVEANVR
jgi:hypothetical protein